MHNKALKRSKIKSDFRRLTRRYASFGGRMFIFYFVVSSITSVIWLGGLGYLLKISLNKSNIRSTHSSGSVSVFFSAFAKAIFVPTNIGNTAVEINVARFSLVVLIVFLGSFYLCIIEFIHSFIHSFMHMHNEPLNH